jgi:hypothetical protein
MIMAMIVTTAVITTTATRMITNTDTITHMARRGRHAAKMIVDLKRQCHTRHKRTQSVSLTHNYGQRGLCGSSAEWLPRPGKTPRSSKFTVPL